jgi:hypothetical protein
MQVQIMPDTVYIYPESVYICGGMPDFGIEMNSTAMSELKLYAMKFCAGRKAAGFAPVILLINRNGAAQIFERPTTKLLQQFRQIAPVILLFDRRFWASTPNGREIKLLASKSSRLLFRLFNRGTPGVMVALVDGTRRQRIMGQKGAA